MVNWENSNNIPLLLEYLFHCHWNIIRQKLDEGFQLAITGSNASLLSRELGSRLTGRHLSRELFPFSYEEFCSFFNLEPGAQSLLDYLEKGGFPLTGIIGVKSPTTVLEYISYFEAAYLIQLLPCFAWSVKAQSLAPKKVYVSDTGLIKTGAFSFSKNYGTLLDAMDFFNLNEGEILTYNTADLILTGGKQINVTPAWQMQA